MRHAHLPFFLALLLAGLAPVPARADAFEDDADAVRAWSARLDDPRAVEDRVVVCFDGPSFLREIGRWKATRYWPVLLWDSDLVPKFIAAFRPKEVLVARIDEKGVADLAAARRAIAEAWGMEAPADAPDADTAPDARAFLDALAKRERAPLGAVLLAEGSPELLGGAALAAGRFHLPLVFETEEKRDQRLKAGRTDAIREALSQALRELDVAFDAKFDDLDFITVANDLPFAYDAPGGNAHPGRYTVDDAIARNDDLGRWGWVGRLTGGAARSVYMAMGALFLQPEQGLFFSRYDPKNSTFGVFSPREAVSVFEALFPTKSIEHPDATLARWRALEWPGGNRYGFLYVNSSGGATSWSTSKGKGTHFDIPDTIPTVVHYTHSGSAGAPFNVDTIAGRWLARGAYVYFGSHAEPYLQAFISPSTLAERVEANVPLGAAMRQLYSPYLVGQREMKVGGEKQMVRFNMSGPWKLAYFGDPSYRLTGKRPERLAPEKAGPTTYRTLKAYLKLRPKTKARRRVHDIHALGAVRLDPKWRKLVDPSAWKKLLKKEPEGETAALLLREMTRRWVAALEREGPHALFLSPKTSKLLKMPDAIRQLLERGVQDDEASRCLIGFAKSTMEALQALPEDAEGREGKTKARWVLVQASRLLPPKGIAKPFHAWVLESCKALGVEKDALKAEILEPEWVPDKVRKAVEAAMK